MPPGNYSVSVLGVGQGERGGAAFRAEQITLLGEKDWRFRAWVDRLGLVGLIPFIAAFIVNFIYRVSIVSLVAVAIGLGVLLPRFWISRSRRYREIERRLHEHEASFPTSCSICAGLRAWPVWSEVTSSFNRRGSLHRRQRGPAQRMAPRRRE